MNRSGGGRQRGRGRFGSSNSRPSQGRFSDHKRGEDARDLNDEWVHDRFDESEDPNDSHREAPSFPSRRNRTHAANAEYAEPGTKVKVNNLHWEITESDLADLFEKKGPVAKCQLVYDKHDRSTGIAFVTYHYPEDAKEAIRAFNGANALGQPIAVRLVDDTPRHNPSSSSGNAAQPSAGRSLFDRIENPLPARRGRGRSRSPDRRRRPRSRSPRRSDVTRPPPGNIDRYIPAAADEDEDDGEEDGGGGGDGRRQASSPRRFPRGDGARRSALPRRGHHAHDAGRQLSKSRPRKTKEELEAELNNDLDSYFHAGTGNGATAAGTDRDGDVEMG